MVSWYQNGLMNNFGFNTGHLYTFESKADVVTFKRILNTVMFIVPFINMIFTSFLKNINLNTKKSYA